MATLSRYDFMTESEIADDETDNLWPDPLSLCYLELKVSSEPVVDKMTGSKISYFWKEAHSILGAPYYDDIILTLNGVSHKNFLEIGDEILFPSLTDIKNSFTKSR